jgi:hypothetical protein
LDEAKLSIQRCHKIKTGLKYYLTWAALGLRNNYRVRPYLKRYYIYTCIR